MRKIINSEAVFIGFMTGVLICTFYDVWVLNTLSALLHMLLHVLSQL